MAEAEKQGHTPTPWAVVEETEFHGIYIRDCSLETVCDLYFKPPDSYEGHYSFPDSGVNAEFIVRACNAHDDLVEALKMAERVINTHIPNEQPVCAPGVSGYIQDAIKKARGES
jgi:hypothetical protein